MTVIHTVASLHAKHGGPSRTVTQMCEALAERGVEVEIISTEMNARKDAILPEENVRVTFASPTLRRLRSFKFGGQVRRRVREQEVDLLHDHGLWLLTNWLSAATARAYNLPYVVSVRGMMQPWALDHRRWKKRIAWWGYQRKILTAAHVLHATSTEEASSIRQKGIDGPIAVIPNGVILPEKQLLSQHSNLESPRHALFLSRIHPIKGLLDLVEAWHRVRPEGWHLLIAGPDAAGHRATVERFIRERNLQEAISFRGPVSNRDKWKLFGAADLFVLPSHSENFGVVVAEALAARVPVITTKGAPWRELNVHDCGWWVGIGEKAVADALREAVRLSDSERRAMGERGRKLVRERYSWSFVAGQMRRVYEWMLEGGVVPDCVRVE